MRQSRETSRPPQPGQGQALTDSPLRARLRLRLLAGEGVFAETADVLVLALGVEDAPAEQRGDLGLGGLECRDDMHRRFATRSVANIGAVVGETDQDALSARQRERFDRSHSSPSSKGLPPSPSSCDWPPPTASDPMGPTGPMPLPTVGCFFREEFARRPSRSSQVLLQWVESSYTETPNRGLVCGLVGRKCPRRCPQLLG
jgi:hypothetical protein